MARPCRHLHGFSCKWLDPPGICIDSLGPCTDFVVFVEPTPVTVFTISSLDCIYSQTYIDAAIPEWRGPSQERLEETRRKEIES